MNNHFLLNDAVLLPPVHLVDPDPWVGHIPFAFWLVEQISPQVLVELGTHTGNSYFAFCQAVQASGLQTQCYAVDTWAGDPQAGYFTEDVYQSVLRHNENHYASFSRLLRQTFDEAAAHFSEGSIDLLHIDGLHTYEAVRHDFETWLPKLSENAVVLFHDMNVRERDFGVWQLWEDLSMKYPHLHFNHSHGLGLLCVGAKPPVAIQELLKEWTMVKEQKLICRFFERLGYGLQLDLRITGLSQTVTDREQHITELCQTIAEQRVLFEDTKSQLKQNQELLTERESQLKQNQELLTERERQHEQSRNELIEVYASRSWRMTYPIRLLSPFVRVAIARFAAYLMSIYRRLPLSLRFRQLLKSFYYRQRARLSVAPGGVVAPVPLSTPFTVKAQASAPIRILLIERSVPKPNQDAGSMMIYNFIQVLRDLGHAVTFYPADLAYDPVYTPALQALGVTCLSQSGVTSLQEDLGVNGSIYNIILTCRPDYTDSILPLLRKYAPQARLVYVTHDLHYIREQRQANLEHNIDLLSQSRWRKEQELRIAKGVDCTIVVSEQERQALLQENAELYVEVIPVVCDFCECLTDFTNRHDLVFIGGYEHQPNVDAVFYFINEIFPLIRQQFPDICFHVVGSHPTPEILALNSENIVVHGFVPDLSKLMASMRISVNPIRFGAGVKGKLITSMAHGVPCIGTPIAFEGMEIIPEQHALVADTAEAFAAAVGQLYCNPSLWEKLSGAGMAMVRQHFSLAVATAGFTRIFNTLLPDALQKEFQLRRAASQQAYQQQSQDARQYRQFIEKELIDSGKSFAVKGVCFVCGREVDFHTDLTYGFLQPDGRYLPNWREQIVCPGCHLNNRLRAAIHLFHLLCAPSLESRLYLTEQTTPIFSWFKKHYRHVSGSEYLGEEISFGASNASGIRNESLVSLSFPTAEFDAILSFDVFEHVPEYLQAFRECLRCLKPGGTLFFTVPFDLQAAQHVERAKIDTDGQIQHLLSPEYHGDPMSTQGCLCFRHFGWELLDQLRDIGFRDVAAYFYWSNRYGYLGDEQLLFKAVK